MNKIKWTFMALAVLLSISGAFATRTHHKSYDSLYYWNGSGYIPVIGVQGVDYECMGTVNVCTYDYSPATQTFTPYNVGNYTPAQ
jgi:hypothetical protein